MNTKIDDILYLNIIMDYLDTDSVEKTARNLSVSPVKVRKVLITEGLWSSRTSLEIQHYLNEKKTTAEIARILNTTEKAVQQYLPYSRGLYKSENRSVDAIKSAEYRRRIQIAKERTIKKTMDISEKEGWTEMSNAPDVLKFKAKCEQVEGVGYQMEQYPGVLCFRELPEGTIDFSKAKCLGEDIVRLHLELIYGEDKDEDYQKQLQEHPEWKIREEKEMAEHQRVLRSYGKVRYGNTISRDIIVTGDMPLYALHYAIQQSFGWQNSHLHHFELPADVFDRITEGKAKNWMELVGVLFQSPMMQDEDRFWNDDYENGSFKTWLRKKYSGPYMSLNHGEGIIQSRADIEHIKKMVSLSDLTTQSLFPLFETSPNHVLERLSIDEVLALRDRGMMDQIPDSADLRESFDSFMDDDLQDDIEEIVTSGRDEPDFQPIIAPCTDTLYYNYDYGDDWYVKITGSLGCEDLVRAGRVTQDDIDAEIVAVYNKYKPVCLAADGLPVLDDVGGISGYIRFLRGINQTKEKAYWKQFAKENALSEEEYLDVIPDNWDYDNADTLEWAKGLGWSNRMPGMKNLL